MEKGLFITFEGIDGTGKSTQACLLAEKLKEHDFSVILTREPGGTPLAEKIRALLLYEKEINFAPITEVMLYAAARAQHVAEVIKPALQRGEIVICERFSDSTLAYQGYATGIDHKLIQKADSIATGGLVPDLTFLLDLDTTEGWSRVRKRNSGDQDRMEAKGFSFLEKVRNGYLEIASKEQSRVKIINCFGKKAIEIHKLLWEIVSEKI